MTNSHVGVQTSRRQEDERLAYQIVHPITRLPDHPIAGFGNPKPLRFDIL
jgi:hypothetical protein